MIADVFAPRPRGLQFIDDAPPLSLIDPTTAADRVGVRRHTLACYRNRGQGPRWFKIGKWARYAPDDLARWLAGEAPQPALETLSALWRPDDAAHLLVRMSVAARVLTISRHCLANYRLENSGPPVRYAGRRVYYSLADLLEWAAARERGGKSFDE